MSGLWAMVSGTLARDPERRSSIKGDFATATIRVGSGDGTQWVSIIAFGDAAARLAELRAGDGVSAAGRAELRSWSGRDGAERHGLSIVASEIAAARPRRKPADSARRGTAGQLDAPDGRPFDDEIPL